ncbi:hypothetical protein Pmani_010489 [Petrolisthes manimaculis]|uniref:Uncharacterized protein n=1 Tax=Petrolisthes manimaculis TaxID=1843537 RepID=A0AAE1UGN9_9EUCA|nr:hypothetical protein Pmani_010489 [Petrolisthes manimaculis]
MMVWLVFKKMVVVSVVYPMVFTMVGIQEDGGVRRAPRGIQEGLERWWYSRWCGSWWWYSRWCGSSCSRMVVFKKMVVVFPMVWVMVVFKNVGGTPDGGGSTPDGVVV